MEQFLSQFGAFVIGGVIPFAYYGKAGYTEFAAEKRNPLIGTLAIYLAAGILMVSGEVDVLSMIPTGFGIPILAGSGGFGFGVSYLMLK